MTSARNNTQVDIQEWLRKTTRVTRLAWIIWGIAIIPQLLNQFHRVAGAVFIDKLMTEFSITAVTVGSVMAMYFYIYAAMQFPSGILADYLGPRKTLTFGGLATGLGSIVFGLAPSLPVLYLGRFLLSLGTSVVYVSVLKLQTQWFRSRFFARIASFLGLLGQVGSLIGTMPLALLGILVGWRLSFELMGLLSLIVCLICWLMVRDSPADLGLPSPAEIERRKSDTLILTSVQDVAATGLRQRLGILLTNKYIWPPFLIGLGSYGTLLVFQGAWGTAYLMQVYSMTRDAAASVVLLSVAGMMIGVLAITFISDRLQRRKLPAIVFAFICLSLWILLTLWNGGKPPVSALYPIFFFIGIFTGAVLIIYTSVKEVVPPSVSGMAMGFVNMSIFLSAAVLQILFGKILDLSWQGAMLEGVRVYPLAAYQSGFVLVSAGVLVFVIGALLLKETRCRDVYFEI